MAPTLNHLVAQRDKGHELSLIFRIVHGKALQCQSSKLMPSNSSIVEDGDKRRNAICLGNGDLVGDIERQVPQSTSCVFSGLGR